MKRLLSLALAFALIVPLVGCQSGGEQDELVIYSGRSKALVDSLVQVYRQRVDTPVRVRYGTDAQLLAALQEEGDQSPADVFWANTTGALSNAIENDMLARLPDSLAQRPTRFVPSSQRWVPITTRFRVLAYNSDRVDSTDLPASVTGLPGQDDLEGRIGWTPAYSSFQDFLTALRTTQGDDVARTWLEGMQELNPKSYTSNTPMIRALAAGEIDVALTNHYYVLRLKHGGGEGEYEGEEEGEEEEEEDEAAPRRSAPVETYHFEDGDLGNLALVTGAGRLQTSDQSAEAHRFLRFLLSERAQAFAATSVNEYPVIPGATVPGYMLPVEEALRLSPEYDFERLEEIDATLEMLRDVGAL
jgi:iron(III) transport system substrate-binding protein